jgi:hypothetical protein
MRHFTPLGTADVLPLRLQIERNDHLWDQHTGRTAYADSPHAKLSDIWLRWRPLDELVKPESYNEPFAELVWYPAAAALPAARGLLMTIMHRTGATAMGGALITKVPPSAQVKPHNDVVSWHASWFGLKVYTVIRTNPNVVNWVDGESWAPAAGDCFAYDNTKPHAVYNEGEEDRWTMMAAFRID